MDPNIDDHSHDHSVEPAEVRRHQRRRTVFAAAAGLAIVAAVGISVVQVSHNPEGQNGAPIAAPQQTPPTTTTTGTPTTTSGATTTAPPATTTATTTLSTSKGPGLAS